MKVQYEPCEMTIATNSEDMMGRVHTAPTSTHCTEKLLDSVAPLCGGTVYYRAQLISVAVSFIQYDEAVVMSVPGWIPKLQSLQTTQLCMDPY